MDQKPENEEIYEVPSLSNIIVQRYAGQMYKEKMHGEGVAYFQGGHIYKGMFSEGLMHGYGNYAWSDGVKYKGEFVSNVPMGHGEYTWLDGSSYEGDIYNAIRHGIGSHKSANTPMVYRGQWGHGKRHGKGVIHYNEDATSWYEGNWRENKREGWGVRCYPSGNIYEGEWKNNMRHGEGTMKWLTLAQQYVGAWQKGVQHGQGTHTWFLKRVPGSQYPQRNEYKGAFVQGERHGQGTFYYASGALYQGEWKKSKKHGQGKFIFRNGHIFEGEFVDDHMAEFPSFCPDDSKSPNLSGLSQRLPGPGYASSMLGPDMTLDLGSLLEKLPENQRNMEREQVDFVVLRHLTDLTSIYSFYSSLGHLRSPDNTFMLSRLQFWRLLKDCNVHHHGTPVAQLDRLVPGDVPPEELHSSCTGFLLNRLISSIVAVAYHTYHKDQESQKNILAACFSKLMRDDILPNAKTVKGCLFSDAARAEVAMSYAERCWGIYKTCGTVRRGASAVTFRQLLLMFKDLDLFDTKLTTTKLLEIITAENQHPGSLSYCNLDLEVTFLEFFEVLLGCAEVKRDEAKHPCQRSFPQSLSGPDTHVNRGSSVAESTQPTPGLLSQSAAATVKCPSSHEDSESVKMEKSMETLNSSSFEDMAAQQNTKSEVSINSDTSVGGESTTRVSEDQAFSHREASAGSSVVGRASALEAVPKSMVSCPPSPEAMNRIWDDEKDAKEGEVDSWIQRTHQFFIQRFFPAYERSQLLNTEVQEERLRQGAKRHIALAMAQENTREVRKAEEDRRENEEEDEAGPRSQCPEGVLASSLFPIKGPLL